MRCYHPANMCNLAPRRDNSKIAMQSGPSSPKFSGVRRVSRKPSTGQTLALAPPLVLRTRNIDQIRYRRRAGSHTPIQFLTSKAKIAPRNGAILQSPPTICRCRVIADAASGVSHRVRSGWSKPQTAQRRTTRLPNRAIEAGPCCVSVYLNSDSYIGIQI